MSARAWPKPSLHPTRWRGVVKAAAAVALITTFTPGIASAEAQPGEGTEARRARVESTIRFLADDLLEGRGTPGRGLDIAAVYLAGELRAAGREDRPRRRVRHHRPLPGVRAPARLPTLST